MNETYSWTILSYQHGQIQVDVVEYRIKKDSPKHWWKVTITTGFGQDTTHYTFPHIEDAIRFATNFRDIMDNVIERLKVKKKMKDQGISQEKDLV